jgi:GxxExxY protein
MSNRAITRGKDLTYKIIGAAREVYKELGPGFSRRDGFATGIGLPCVIAKEMKMVIYWIYKILHGVNEDALCYELDLLGIAYQRQLELDVHYKNVVFDRKFRDDLLIEKKILVENKALKKITNQDEAQLINYFSKGIPMGKNNTIKSRVII